MLTASALVEPADGPTRQRWMLLVPSPIELLHALQRTARLRPSVATRRVLAITTGIYYIVCGTLSLLSNLAIAPKPAESGPLNLFCAIGAISGVLVLVFGAAFNRWLYHLIVAAGVLMVAGGIALSGGGERALVYGSIYAVLAIYCFFFFAWPAALLHTIFAQVVIALAFGYAHVPRADSLPLQGFALMTSLLVGWLAHAAAAAEVDSLTTLSNRRGLDRRAREAMAHARRFNQGLAVILIDFDDFKQINDTGGHASGDRALRIAARDWRALMPAGAVLARQGGDEFAVVLIGVSVEDAVYLADQMRGALRPDYSCSAGVAAMTDGDSLSKLFARADVALYQSKSAGGNQTILYDADNQRSAADIHRGLAAGEFEVYYQPIVDLETELPVGDEALVRWISPDRGVVHPDVFVPEAEHSGAIVALGDWILREACATAARYHHATGELRRVSVNASGPELAGSNYDERVAAILAETGLPPRLLVIEVTETTLDADRSEVLAVLTRLAELGVGVAIDDFGTGYSSLSRLERLPVNVLKVDKSFVDAIPEVGGDVPVLRAIVALAAALDLRLIVEGIEHSFQARLLRELGCRYGQGYYFGEPSAEVLPHPTAARRPSPDRDVIHSSATA